MIIHLVISQKLKLLGYRLIYLHIWEQIGYNMVGYAYIKIHVKYVWACKIHVFPNISRVLTKYFPWLNVFPNKMLYKNSYWPIFHFSYGIEFLFKMFLSSQLGPIWILYNRNCQYSLCHDCPWSHCSSLSMDIVYLFPLQITDCSDWCLSS